MGDQGDTKIGGVNSDSFVMLMTKFKLLPSKDAHSNCKKSHCDDSIEVVGMGHG